MPADPPRRAAFPTTRITLIQAANGEPGAEAHQALSLLCGAYWYPVYAYVRRFGHSHEEAEDLTQGFFMRILDKHSLRDFDRERGSFQIVSSRRPQAFHRQRARCGTRAEARRRPRSHSA
jgi:RNA polymerase sigma-70 factor (ECF subfamily)